MADKSKQKSNNERMKPLRRTTLPKREIDFRQKCNAKLVNKEENGGNK